MNPLVRYIREALQGYYADAEASSIAKMLLMDKFGFSNLEFYGGKDKVFSEKEQELLDESLARLCNREPIQYIIGTELFKGLTFEVNDQVLIPRPETQELVDWIVQDFQSEEGCRVLDIGTGSGCISVSLACFLNRPQVEAWDVSEGALEVARKNAERNNVEVVFRQQDVFKPSPNEPFYDVIVSNPPYITEKEKVNMEANVLDWEPHTALFVPDSAPLLFYERIARIGLERLKSGGALYVEINRQYGKETCAMLENMGYKKVELRKDMFGNDRMIKAIK